MSTLAVSSFSLHRILGPLHLERQTADGGFEEFELPLPREHSLEEFAVLVRDRLGVTAVELCQIQFDSSSQPRAEALASALKASGVRVLTVPIDIGDLAGGSDSARERDMARIERWFAVAHRLGARYVRVNTGSPVSGGTAEDRSGLIASLRALAVTAERDGMRLLVENHGGPDSHPDFLLGLRAEVGPEHLGILLDLGNFEPVATIGHARLTGKSFDEAGVDREPVYEHIARLAPVADLVHAKAYDPASDGSPLLDLDRALGIVAASGYEGSISVEWEGIEGDPWTRTAETVAAVRAAFPNLA
ncbi:sugar phosphate isomerase/epimerase [Streptomyces phaeochromogenes]|uniref:Sugar phosphate isomerase/epimerase n=1 Tax=Streptomyces phaeochromogenes TaxID=1923 RepID=A0ABZ1HNB0_STRPH|nr:sugar phosphate isomerase/epimerase family protein [Streptomyces phaeochromogenes]WSD19745.1 sugar phosphate isomerase/epimerase [Streptomyces phaeochromogenes]